MSSTFRKIGTLLPWLLLIVVCLIVPTPQTTAQSQKQWSSLGDKSFKERDYYGASLYYRKGMVLDSGNLEIVYKYAESLRLYNEYELGEKYYQYVYRRDQGKTYREALFWFASMQKYNARYQDARKNFQRFIASNKDKSTYYYLKAQQEVKSCEYAQTLMRDTLPLTVTNLGPSVNTTNAEFSPAIKDVNTLYFSSLRSDKITEISNEVKDPLYHIRIYEASRNDSAWTLKQALPEPINSSDSHNGNGTYTTDGQQFYFTRCNEDFNCKIFRSQLVNGAWSPPQETPLINQNGYTSTQPFITTIGEKQVMFFASDMPGTTGKLDIWFCELQGTAFTGPVNAGPNVNTLDDETSPFYSSAETALYFSSEWHAGLGGFDIFKSGGLPSQLSAASNLGYPINTSVNDFYFYIFAPDSKGYLTSNRKGSITSKGETCCNDIWEVDLKGKKRKDSIVVVRKPSQFVPVRLYFHNDEPDRRSWDTVTTLTYKQTYDMYTALKSKYIQEYAIRTGGQEQKEGEEKINNLFLNYVDKGAANLEIFTDQLIERLQRGEKLEITVKGYASPLAKTDYNINLTLRRISSMENFMRSYRDSICLPYFNHTAPNGGEVSIVRIPFGEYKAALGVSDNFNVQSQSVYSPEAALERKIEILSVRRASKDTATAEATFRKEIHNFGSVNETDSLQHIFLLKNTGNLPLVISSVRDSCACITTLFSGTPIAPGASAPITVKYIPLGQIGKKAHHIWIESNALTAMRELTITAEVKKAKIN